ncbi:MAG: hypothetical protein R3F44_01380 [Candidatus Competibacteraceae bacterium]
MFGVQFCLEEWPDIGGDTLPLPHTASSATNVAATPIPPAEPRQKPIKPNGAARPSEIAT